MTKLELIQFLEPFMDDIEIKVEINDRDQLNFTPTWRLNMSDRNADAQILLQVSL